MATNVVGLFDDRDEAQNAVKRLVDIGIPHGDISVVASNAHGKAERTEVDDAGTMAEEGAATGATSGLVVGGIIGALAGIGLGFVPFLGFLVAGPLAGAITGAAAGLVTGGLLGGLIGLGIPEEHAHAYAEGVRRGGILVAARVDETMVSRAHEIMDGAGAVNIEDRVATYRETGWDKYDEKAPAFTPEETLAERSRYRSSTSRSYAYADQGDAPGVQTGGRAVDGTPDTRGIMEKTADTLTGDKIDDKTGKRID